MRLKQIKLVGFKSFVDPTLVTFPGNRCAIVGPNGCGKSNVVDAVRWVMGESSARQLRGEALTDVIFNGAAGRKLAGLAAVELSFDNSDGRIGGEYAAFGDIVVRREVTREARSTYFLNGVQCRRRDVADVFFGTGIGPRSYSIIEQGMISALVESRPEELRAHLEEAAGISKYKERRRETENRIRHTEENLARLQDIREELAQQLERLQRQAKAAERYRNLQAERRQADAQLHAIRSRRLAGELGELQRALERKEVAFEKQRAELRRLEAELEDVRVTRAEEGDALNETQGRHYKLGAGISKDEEALKHYGERLQDLRTELETVVRRSEETTKQLDFDQAKVEALKGEIAALTPAVEVAEADDARAAAQVVSLEDEYRKWEAEWETFNRRVAGHDRDIGIHCSRRDQFTGQIERQQARLRQLESEQLAPVQADGDGIEDIAAQIDGLGRQRLKLNEQLGLCLEQLGAEQECLAAKEAELEAVLREVQQLRHTLAHMQAAQQIAVGRSDAGVRAWLEDQGLVAAVRLGELLSVAPGWEHAVEMVLGDFVQALRVEDLDVYATEVSALADGHVALVEGRLDAEVSGELPSLASLVRRSDMKLGSLLHGVFAAESDEVAFSKRTALKPGESIVTRTGLWLGRDWLRCLPKIGADAGVIERGQDVETQEGRVMEAEQRLDELRALIVDARHRSGALADQREALRGRIAEVDGRIGQLEGDRGVRQVKLEQAQSRQARLKREQQEALGQLEQEEKRLAKAQALLAVAEQALAREQESKRTLLTVKDGLSAALAEARREARACHDRLHVKRGEQQRLFSSLEAVGAVRQRLVAQSAELAESRQRIEKSQASIEAHLPQLRQSLESRLRQRVAVEVELSALRRRGDELNVRQRTLSAAKVGAEETVEGLQRKLEALRVGQAELRVQESHLLEAIAASGHTLDALLVALPEGAEETDWEEKLAGIDRRLQRLGAINLAAIEELEERSERKAYLDAQHQDLTKALNTLEQAIQKIDRETRARFKETFDRVNGYLGALFPKVFGGGSACLEMTGTDLLSTGVSLMARPPGKRNTSVNLLSGGEKAMTALALVFSIFQLNPSPVCLLDEVDAPLDDVNVVRFAGLIEEMSEDVQFVVVTHNKLTMEMADHLMGVTMREPGVSRIVSVDVEKAAAMAVA